VFAVFEKPKDDLISFAGEDVGIFVHGLAARAPDFGLAEHRPALTLRYVSHPNHPNTAEK
jgi:hypothetical protein